MKTPPGCTGRRFWFLTLSRIPSEDEGAAVQLPYGGAETYQVAEESVAGISARGLLTGRSAGATQLRIGCGSLYVTTNYDEHGICEVFTSTGKAGGCPSQSEATARLASIALRSGISVQEVYDQLKGIRCPSTIRQQGLNCTSCPDAIAKVLMKVSKYIEQNKGPADIVLIVFPRLCD